MTTVDINSTGAATLKTTRTQRLSSKIRLILPGRRESDLPSRAHPFVFGKLFRKAVKAAGNIVGRHPPHPAIRKADRAQSTAQHRPPGDDVVAESDPLEKDNVQQFRLT
jgi:hypothetical protein